MPGWVVYLIIFAVSYAVSVAMAPSPAEPKRPSLTDLDIPTAEPGRPIPVVFGTVTVKSPNVVWYGDLATMPVKTNGGK